MVRVIEGKIILKFTLRGNKNYFEQASSQDFLRRGAIQREDGPTSCQRLKSRSRDGRGGLGRRKLQFERFEKHEYF